MAAAEKVAPGSNGHVSVWTANVQIWVQADGGMHPVPAGV